MTSAEKKLRQAARRVDRLRRELQTVSAAYLRLVKPTDVELSVLADDLWQNISEDIDTDDLPHWDALLAETILDERKNKKEAT